MKKLVHRLIRSLIIFSLALGLPLTVNAITPATVWAFTCQCVGAGSGSHGGLPPGAGLPPAPAPPPPPVQHSGGGGHSSGGGSSGGGGGTAGLPNVPPGPQYCAPGNPYWFFWPPGRPLSNQPRHICIPNKNCPQPNPGVTQMTDAQYAAATHGVCPVTSASPSGSGPPPGPAVPSTPGSFASGNVQVFWPDGSISTQSHGQNVPENPASPYLVYDPVTASLQNTGACPPGNVCRGFGNPGQSGIVLGPQPTGANTIQYAVVYTYGPITWDWDFSSWNDPAFAPQNTSSNPGSHTYTKVNSSGVKIAAKQTITNISCVSRSVGGSWSPPAPCGTFGGNTNGSPNSGEVRYGPTAAHPIEQLEPIPVH